MFNSLLTDLYIILHKKHHILVNSSRRYLLGRLFYQALYIWLTQSPSGLSLIRCIDLIVNCNGLTLKSKLVLMFHVLINIHLQKCFTIEKCFSVAAQQGEKVQTFNWKCPFFEHLKKKKEYCIFQFLFGNRQIHMFPAYNWIKSWAAVWFP